MFSVYSDSSIAAAGVSKDRFLFIARNFRADATVDIQEMRGPLLALWGQDDLNVPAFENALKYRQITANRQNGESIIKIYESSTHGLLKAQFFNYQLDSQWPEWKKMLFTVSGRRAYSENSLSDISSFILHNIESRK
ncbi:hypothetical protein D3C71_1500900 [compost metagenome]